MERLALLAITAHPGDELAIAGLLAQQAQAGVYVTLVCATRGLDGAAARAARLEEDLRRAAERLGVSELHLLDYRAAPTPDERPVPTDRLLHAGACTVVRQLVHFIRVIQPQVLVTFGPDGIDGQADHVAIGELATEAFGAAGDARQFPPDGGPELYAPVKLYYLSLPQGLFDLAGLPGPGSPEPELRTRVDVTPFVDLKIEAARCYQGHASEHMVSFWSLPDDERRHLLSVEFLTLTQPQPDVADALDTRPFAGVR
jgi:LmbE family N-acetylglucosaminyl deacetylase